MTIVGLPSKKKDDDEPVCNWCHPLRTCWKQGFDNINCPRVSAIQFLDANEIHDDGWHIAAVQFGEPDMQFEIVSDEDATGDADVVETYSHT